MYISVFYVNKIKIPFRKISTAARKKTNLPDIAPVSPCSGKNSHPGHSKPGASRYTVS